MGEGTTGRGRPQETWDQVVQSDLWHLHLKKEFAKDHNGWRDAFKKTPSPTHGKMERTLNNYDNDDDENDEHAEWWSMQW